MNPCPRCIKGRLLQKTCLNCGFAEEVIPVCIIEERERRQPSSKGSRL